jgi:hypothetical protein
VDGRVPKFVLRRLKSGERSLFALRSLVQERKHAQASPGQAPEAEHLMTDDEPTLPDPKSEDERSSARKRAEQPAAVPPLVPGDEGYEFTDDELDAFEFTDEQLAAFAAGDLSALDPDPVPAAAASGADGSDGSDGSDDELRPMRVLPRYAPYVPFLSVLAAILTVAASALLWVTSPNWATHITHSTAIRNVGTIPTKVTRTVGVADESLLAPNRVQIPRLAVTAPIINVGTTPTGALDVPLDPKTVGWWSPGARPGAKKGTAILAGHINYAGVEGALANIGSLNPGDDVFVWGLNKGKEQRLHFVITGVRTYDKEGLPYKEIFNQNIAGRLILVTCGGPFDAQTGNYLDNIVAYAVLK